MIHMLDIQHMHWDPNHPYRWRTWLRSHLPWFLIDLGLARKASNCENIGAEHWWYNVDGVRSACYHCEVIREVRLWRGADSSPPNPYE